MHRGTPGRQNVRDLFLKYRNVVAYVAGHTHENDIHLFKKGRTGFWQINTASHADSPQQSREIEVMDNRDGTLSLFTTILDHAAPTAAPAPGTAAATLDRRAARAASPAACSPSTTRRPSEVLAGARSTATWSCCCATLGRVAHMRSLVLLQWANKIKNVALLALLAAVVIGAVAKEARKRDEG